MTRPVDIVHSALPACDILAARFGDTGQVSLNVYRPRDVVETAATAGLGALAMRAMARGTSSLDAGELAFAFESLGGSLGSTLGADLIGVGATVFAEHVPRATGLLLDVLESPRFDPASVSIEQALLADDARAVADDMVRFPMQLAFGVAFDDAGYGAPALGTADSVAAFTVADVHGWHTQVLSGARTTIIAVGDLDAGPLAAAITGVLHARGWTPVPSRAPVTRPAHAVRAGQRVVRRDRRQSALAMLFPGPGRGSPDRFAAETWSAIAGGLGGRLFETLRSERSLAYTVIANSWQRRRAGGVLNYIACDPGRLDEARDAMLVELDQFRQRMVTDDELQRATALLVGQVEMSRQTAGALAGEIADAWLLGTGLGELDDPAAPYRAVTAAAVRDLAVRAFDPAGRAEGVVAGVAE